MPCGGACVSCPDPALLDPRTCQCTRNVPRLSQEFPSSSGQTLIQYYEYNSGLCTGAGGDCRFGRGIIHLPTGFDLVEVFLAGFQLETAAVADAVETVQVQVAKHRYDATTGDLELSVSAILMTASRQDYAYRVAFVVVLTDSNLALFTPIGGSCYGPAGECTINQEARDAIPTGAGWNYIGLASQTWHLSSQSGPVPLQTLSAEPILIAPPTPTAVEVEYRCAIHHAAKRNDMSCDWAAMIVAFDSGELEGHVGSLSSRYGGSLAPQYLFVDGLDPYRRVWTAASPSPLGSPITGFFDAFAGLSLAFDPTSEFPVWSIVNAAGNVQVVTSDTASTDYEVFLGTGFGEPFVSEPFAFQASRAFGFLH
jgi:hypothetical protein